jgi:hypothetical protein
MRLAGLGLKSNMTSSRTRGRRQLPHERLRGTFERNNVPLRLNFEAFSVGALQIEDERVRRQVYRTSDTERVADR